MTPPVLALPAAAPPKGAAGGTVQPCGFLTDLWNGLTSCFRGRQDNFEPLQQEGELQRLDVVVQKSGSHLVDQGDSSTLKLNDSYFPGDLTACAMVFVLDGNGGCVYHWPFHTISGEYLSEMQAAMRKAKVARAVSCQVFGRDYGLSNRKRGEYLESWREFGVYIQESLDVVPEISLCEDVYSNPILMYTVNGIESRFPPFTSLATLMG